MRTKEQLLKLCKLMPCTPVGLLSYGIMTQEEYNLYFKPKDAKARTQVLGKMQEFREKHGDKALENELKRISGL